jgi:hypothetical protein
MADIDKDQVEKQRELESLYRRVERLEAELTHAPRDWPPQEFYFAYHVVAGFVLGMFGAATSLVFNIVGSLIVGQHPLRLIQVYLTFPMGAEALQVDHGLTLATGCCLYLGTGMLLGIPFHLVLSRWFPAATLLRRLGVVSVLAVAVWLINYYGILSWLQPLLFGGNWIVELVPWPVAALTHLVFGWTMALVQPLGEFRPFVPNTERK